MGPGGSLNSQDLLSLKFLKTQNILENSPIHFILVLSGQELYILVGLPTSVIKDIIFYDNDYPFISNARKRKREAEEKITRKIAKLFFAFKQD